MAKIGVKLDTNDRKIFKQSSFSQHKNRKLRGMPSKKSTANCENATCEGAICKVSQGLSVLCFISIGNQPHVKLL